MHKSAITQLVIILSLICGQAVASIHSDLDDFFDSMQLATNITPAGAYEGQTAGYYTGGNLFARVPTRNYNLMTVQLPAARAGCGGIDLFTGGFSFINSDQLVAMMRNIGSNAVSLAFQVALSTISPKLSGLLQDMQDMANKINAGNFNSCEAAANLLGGVLPKTDASQKALCQSIGTGNGIFGDYAASRQGCGTGGQRSTIIAGARGDSRFKDLIPDGNIVWNALKKISSTSSDTQLAEMVMSLTGTVIYPLAADDSSPITPNILPPTIKAENDRDLLAFLRGGEVTIWHCDSTGEFECRSPTRQNITISEDDGYAARVADILTGMIDNMYNESPLTTEQLNLLNETSLPVYKMLNVATAYSPAYAENWKSTYADAIALDLIYQYFKSLTYVVGDAVDLLQLPEAITGEFQKRVIATRNSLERMRADKTSQVDQTIQMMQESMTIERMLISAMSPGLASSVQWARTVQ
jgi:conjugative transfer pilus assembly protein TraH